MEINANQANLKSEPAVESFLQMLRENESALNFEDAIVYHNFPLYRDSEEAAAKANILIITPLHGIILCQCTGVLKNSSGLEAELEKLEHIYHFIFSKLIKNKIVRKGRNELGVSFIPVIYYEGEKPASNADEDLFGFANDFRKFQRVIQNQQTSKYSDTLMDECIATIEGSRGILKPKERLIADEEKQTKAALLKNLESQIARYDRDQKRAALNIVVGPQRIRGLAGSGKTIILTWKAALLHLDDPQREIIYTYFTKSLHQLIKQLITRFFRQYSDVDPNWEKIRIMHAWGGQAVEGVYSMICRENDLPMLTLNQAKMLGNHPFDEICKKLLTHEVAKTCDYLIMDEAQDFPVSFYRLCHRITREGSVIWGYDDCQNILNIEIQDTIDTFGKDEKNVPLVDFSKYPIQGGLRDIVLHKSYRNPRNILHIAFALGFGLYGDQIVQILENNEHWADLGFKVLSGNSEINDEMIIERPVENSPLLFDSKYPNHENILSKSFDSIDSECEFIFNRIKHDFELGLTGDDIVIVSLDDAHTKRYFSKLEALLQTADIGVFNLQTAPFNSTIFRVENHVTLSTVYKCKGNEAASVYVLGIDMAYRERSTINMRNKLFTAISRSRCWVTLTGFGPYMEKFEIELRKILSDFPKYHFKMPDPSNLKRLRRDLDAQQAEENRVERQLELMATARGVTVEELIDELAAKRKKK